MSGLFSKPKMPEIEPPTPLPDEDEQRRMGRKRIAKETASSGVQSTLLSTGGRETLGA